MLHVVQLDHRVWRFVARLSVVCSAVVYGVYGVYGSAVLSLCSADVYGGAYSICLPRVLSRAVQNLQVVQL